MTVGERIKNRRIELGLTQTDIAKRAGYKDKTSVSKLENAGDDITMKQLNRLAPALECSSAFLMGWADSYSKDNESQESSTLEETEQPGEKKYYFSEETARMAQELLENPDTRMLFDAARGAKPEDLKMAADLLNRFKETNRDV